MDGTGVTATTGAGGGKVNCQFGAAAFEKFKVRPQADGSYAFESAAFPKVYLRMDGSGVTANLTDGGGKVNCQFGAGTLGPYEKFRAVAQADGSFSFESAAFPKVYLRLNGAGLTSNANGGSGTVNCQFDANGGIHEKFVLDLADQSVDFDMQHQEQTWWCWNAASVSVAKFYNRNAAWTQGLLANAEFARNDCVVDAGRESPCNWGRWPDGPLDKVGHFGERLNNALTSMQLATELAKPAPVVVNIAWRDGNGTIVGGHIVALRGRSLRDGVEWVSVSDPWSGDSDMTYDNFRNRYPDNGLWNVSYKTRPQG
ncbi:fascin domain-containing protein [Saccharothrix sp. NRRL B-16348]|uniref:fascin domain-containing protein n=1 Tax=Saccharothrix sp. NRRL B-16348 TaxID=1415542 RepID=UPI0018D14187|nr:papain-like cysteine protease family protein [Saccharothrix sp. NRRL B-16348]